MNYLPTQRETLDRSDPDYDLLDALQYLEKSRVALNVCRLMGQISEANYQRAILDLERKRDEVLTILEEEEPEIPKKALVR